jgi:hypothetical protein
MSGGGDRGDREAEVKMQEELELPSSLLMTAGNE